MNKRSFENKPEKQNSQNSTYNNQISNDESKKNQFLKKDTSKKKTRDRLG